MANGIAGGLEDILGLNTTAGTAELQQAIAALQAVGVPNAAQLTLPELQKYVQAGVLTPQQYSAISENPQAYQQAFQAAQDTTGTQAQKAALQQISGVAQTGSTPIMEAQLRNAINAANQNATAQRGAITQNAQERGVAGGGQEYLQKLLAEQGNATNANQGAIQAAANNAQLALQAMTQGGQLGGQLQGQANQTAEAQAQAAQQIAQYNSQLQSAANQYNTQNANAAQAANLGTAQRLGEQNTGLQNFRTQYNAQIPAEEFNMQMQKAGGLANAYGNMGQLKQQQAAGQNQFIGGLIGAGATIGGDYLMGQAAGKAGAQAAQDNMPKDYDPYTYPQYAHGGEVCYAQGGEVHDHELCMKAGGMVPGKALHPGDTTANDTVPARLSPHEIVLPRTVAQAPNAPQAAAQFVGGVKGMAAPLSFADVIKKLEENGLELRLGVK
jgi:hypothetical protein